MLNYRCTYCSETTKAKDCILDGKYCPTLPSTHHKLLGMSHSPMDMIKQSIREQCAYEAIEKPEHRSHWFLYV